MRQCIFLLLAGALWTVPAGAAAGSGNSLTVTAQAGGDLTGDYDFSGPLGRTLKAMASGKPRCELSALFRRANYRGREAVEAWLTLDCGDAKGAGAKTRYKPHRIYLEPGQTEQLVRLPALAPDLQNVQLKFRDLSLKLGK